jgi:WD40 repeat protein
MSVPPETVELFCTLTDSTGPVENIALSADGQRVASGSRHLPVKFWNTHTGQLLHEFKSYRRYVALSADGLFLACNDEENRHEIRLWNTQTYQSLLTIPFSGMIPFGPWKAVLSANGQFLACCGINSELDFWDTQRGECLQKFNVPGFGSGIQGIALSADGHILVSCNNRIRLWDTQTGDLFNTIIDKAESISVSLSADGQLLASGSRDRTIKLWNTQTGDLLHTLIDDADTTTISLSADGQLLARGSDDRTIKLWNMQTGDLLHTFTGHTGRVNSVALSANGHILASGSDDQTIKIWRIKR